MGIGVLFFYTSAALMLMVSFLPMFALWALVTWANMYQRQELGKWMNIDEKVGEMKTNDAMAVACACCCACFQYSAESRTVDDWMKSTLLVQQPLKLAHEANKMVKQAASQAGAKV